MNRFTYAAITALLLGAFLFLAQLWLEIFAAEVFVKLMITLGVLTAAFAIVAFVVKEKQDSHKLHNGDDLL
jgi:hypothetical protein